jgi:hypothetical protein
MWYDRNYSLEGPAEPISDLEKGQLPLLQTLSELGQEMLR